MKSKDTKKHVLIISLAVILLLMIGSGTYYGIYVFEFDLQEEVDDSGRTKDDPYRIRSGLDLKLAVLNLAPCPIDVMIIKSEEKGNLLRTRVRFRGEFSTPQQELTKWILASPGLEGVNISDNGINEISLPPPGGASQSTLMIDKKAGKVGVSILFGK